MIVLTREAWKKFAPGCPQEWTDALFSSLNLLQEAGLFENERRWCHFAATVYEETGDFREIRESLNYRTCAALRKAWPSRFGHKSDAELKPLLRNERGLAAAVYQGRMGNRTPEDAFDFRGGGWIQTTGRSAVEKYCRKLEIEPDHGTLDDPLLTLRFALLEWKETDCNRWADENSLRKVAKAINTGSATSGIEPVGMDERKKAFARAWKLWGESGNAEAPVGESQLSSAARRVALGAAPAGGLATGGVMALANNFLSAPEVAIGEAQRRLDQANQAKAVISGAREFTPARVNSWEVYAVPVTILLIGLTIAWWISRKGD